MTLCLQMHIQYTYIPYDQNSQVLGVWYIQVTMTRSCRIATIINNIIGWQRVCFRGARASCMAPRTIPSRLQLPRAPKDHINTRILQTTISGILLYRAIEPECEISMFMWPCVGTLSPNSKPHRPSGDQFAFAGSELFQEVIH